MRFLIFLLSIITIDFYVHDAVMELVNWWMPTWSGVVNALYWGLPVVLVLFVSLLGRIGVGPEARHRFRPLISFFILTYLSKLVIGMVLLVGDVFRYLAIVMAEWMNKEVVYDGRPLWLVVLAILVGVVPLLILLYGMLRNKYRYRIFREQVAIDHLPEALEGLKIVQISDIHAGSFSEKNQIQKAVDLILAEEPDLFFFTGDLVNTVAREVEPFIPIFSKIKAKYGVYSIMGNHDYGDYAAWPDSETKAKNRRALEAAHHAIGWQLLNNQNEILEIEGAKVAVIGVENFSGSRHFSQYGDLAKAYSGTEVADIRLCLSHDPTHWEVDILPNFPDIELTLSGHTHGGQFGIEMGQRLRWSPVQYVYKHWAGLYKEANQYLYVNRGFGFLGYPGRVGILPEITVLELTRTRQ